MITNSHYTKTSPVSKLFDAAGMTLSFLCMIHCLALPLLFSCLPWLESCLGTDERVHIAFAIFVLPIGLLALASGYRHHGQAWIFLWGLAGMLCLATAVVASSQLGGNPGARLERAGQPATGPGPFLQSPGAAPMRRELLPPPLALAFDPNGCRLKCRAS